MGGVRPAHSCLHPAVQPPQLALRPMGPQQRLEQLALRLEQPWPRTQPAAQSRCEERESLLSGKGRRSGSTDQEAEDSRPGVGTSPGTRATPLQRPKSLDHRSTLHLWPPWPAALLPTRFHDCNRQAQPCPASSSSASTATRRTRPSLTTTGLLIHPIPIFHKSALRIKTILLSSSTCRFFKYSSNF